MEKNWKVFIKDLIFLTIATIFLVLSIVEFFSNGNTFFHIKKNYKLDRYELNKEDIEEIIKNVEKNENGDTTNKEEDKKIEEIIKQNKK